MARGLLGLFGASPGRKRLKAAEALVEAMRMAEAAKAFREAAVLLVGEGDTKALGRAYAGWIAAAKGSGRLDEARAAHAEALDRGITAAALPHVPAEPMVSWFSHTGDPQPATEPSQSGEEIAAYSWVHPAYGASSVTAGEHAAVEMFNKAGILLQQGMLQKAITTYDQAITAYATYSSQIIRQQIAKALANKGYILATLGKPREALATCNQAISTFSANHAPAFREAVAMALYNKSIALGMLAKLEETIAVYDHLVTAYGADSATAQRVTVATALVNKGVALAKLGKRKEEIATYDQVIAAYNTDPSPILREEVLKSLSNKSTALILVGRLDEAISTCDSVISASRNSPSPSQHPRIANMLVNKGVAEVRLNRLKKGIGILDRVIDTYSAYPAPALREQVARALVAKAEAFSRQGEIEEAISTCDRLIRAYDSDPFPALRAQVAAAIAYKGVLFEALGHHAKALILLRKALLYGITQADAINYIKFVLAPRLFDLDKLDAPIMALFGDLLLDLGLGHLFADTTVLPMHLEANGEEGFFRVVGAIEGNVRLDHTVSRVIFHLEPEEEAWAEFLLPDGRILGMSAFRPLEGRENVLQAEVPLGNLTAVDGIRVRLTRPGESLPDRLRRSAEAEWRSGDWGQAAVLLSALAKTRCFLALSEVTRAERESWLAHPALADAHADAALARLRADAADGGEDGPAKAAHLLEMNQAVTLSQMQAFGGVDVEVLRQSSPELAEEFLVVRERYLSIPIPTSAILDEALKDPNSRFAWRLRLEEVIARIRFAAPEAVTETALDIEEAAAPETLVAAAGDTPVVYLAAGHDAGVAVILRQGRFTGQEMFGLSRHAVEALLAPFGQAADLHGDAYTKAFTSALPEICRYLWNGGFGEVVRQLVAAGEQKAILVPCGRMGFLPWHAAARSDGKGGVRYALEDVAFAQTPSLRILGRAAKRPAAERDAACILVDTLEDAIGDLAEAECNMIAGHFPAVQKLAGDDLAPEAALKALFQPLAVLHAFCHGEADPRSPLESRLLLPGGRELKADAILSAARARPNAEVPSLITLAACEVGLRGETIPDEAVSFATVLLAAGAEAVVAPFWRVEAAATHLLMEEFYNNLRRSNNADPTLALRDAQVALLRAGPSAGTALLGPGGPEIAAPVGSDNDSANPFFWAAFQVTVQGTGKLSQPETTDASPDPWS